MTRKTLLPILAALLLAVPAAAGDEAGDPAAAELVTLYQQMQSRLAADQAEGVPQLAALIAQKTEPCACGGEHQAEYQAVNAAALTLQGGDLAALRERFKPLSRAMAALVQATGAAAQLYYCPMAAAYWLQPLDEAQIRNPYLGAEMLACGRKAEKLES